MLLIANYGYCSL